MPPRGAHAWRLLHNLHPCHAGQACYQTDLMEVSLIEVLNLLRLLGSQLRRPKLLSAFSILDGFPSRKLQIKSFALLGLADRGPMMYITNSPRSMQWSQPTKCHFCSILILSHLHEALEILPYRVIYGLFIPSPSCLTFVRHSRIHVLSAGIVLTLASDSSSHGGTSSMMPPSNDLADCKTEC